MRGIIFALVFAISCPAIADEIRPCFLEVTQESELSYKILWKTPSQGEARSARELYPEFPSDGHVVGIKTITIAGDAVLESYLIEFDTSLVNRPITIRSLELTSSDVLVRAHYEDGATEFIRVLPENPSFILTHQSGLYNLALTYARLGIGHILEGLDHLLFVLVLLLLVGDFKVLIKTITAFTIAHSITLALATMDFIHLSSRAVEATIALSIVFVAAEVVYSMYGHRHLSQKYPWLVAFGFGLIHGLGFADALREIGLPHDEIVPSLIFFNVGVEVGQLIFVSAMLILARLFGRLVSKYTFALKAGTAYSVGSIAFYWLLQRISIV